MRPDKERQYIADAKGPDRRRRLGVTHQGLAGRVEPAKSGHTLQFLADAGFEYCLDWPNDEQAPTTSAPRRRC